MSGRSQFLLSLLCFSSLNPQLSFGPGLCVVPCESSLGLGSPRPGSQVTGAGWQPAARGGRGASRIAFPSHHRPTAGRRRGLPTSRQSAAGPARGPPCRVTRPPRTDLEELGRAARHRPGGEALPSSAADPSLCPSRPVRARPGAPVIGRAPGAQRVPAKRRRRPRPGLRCGWRCSPARRCHARGARRAAAVPSRQISAGQGTSGGAEDEGARARAPADCQPRPRPRPARSPRPPRTRLRRSSHWSSDTGGSCGVGGGGAGRASAQNRGGSSGAAAAPAAMSCAEVMYHPQPYGAPQYLPNPVAAATCPTAYYHPAPQPGQQKKLAVYSKMQDSLEVTLPSKQEEEEEEEDEEEEEKDQPAEMEYLNSRCVLFTYFQGDIGSVVDEHFSRALGQASMLHPESAISKSKMGLTPLWRDSSALASPRSSFPTSFWTSSYQPPPAPCLGGVHPDFQVAAPPGAFPTAEPSPWPGHGLHQPGPAAPPPGSESWHYPLASQVSPPYSHVHDVYLRHHHPHAHVHHRHHHHHRRHPSSAGSALEASYGPLLMPAVRAARIPAPQGDITKTESTTVTTATSAWAGAFHGTVDIVPSVGFDTGLQHQDKSKESPWY